MPLRLNRSSKAIAALVLCCLTPSLAHSQTAHQPKYNGDKVPPTSWVDPTTGHRIIRLSSEPGSGSLYFNINSYTPDGKEMVYNTPTGISVVNLETYKTRQIVNGRVKVIAAGRKSPNVFYVQLEEHAVYATNVDTGTTKKLADIPAGADIQSINSDETLVAGTYIEGKNNHGGPGIPSTHTPNERRNKGQMMEERLAAHLPLVLFTADLRDGKQTILLHSTDWVNHLLFSPTDPTMLMYCHEGPWHKVDRIWTIRTDGTQNTLVHKRQMAMEIAGHEFWSHDGKTIWYDLQIPRGEDFFLAGYNIETGKRTWYHLQRNEWSIHYNVSPQGDLFTGDGGDINHVAKAPDNSWLYLFRPQLIDNSGVNADNFVQPGVFHAEKLVNMSRHEYHLEPNVNFTPDQKFIVFRSNMFAPIMFLLLR